MANHSRCQATHGLVISAPEPEGTKKPPSDPRNRAHNLFLKAHLLYLSATDCSAEIQAGFNCFNLLGLQLDTSISIMELSAGNTLDGSEIQMAKMPSPLKSCQNAVQLHEPPCGKRKEKKASVSLGTESDFQVKKQCDGQSWKLPWCSSKTPGRETGFWRQQRLTIEVLGAPKLILQMFPNQKE